MDTAEYQAMARVEETHPWFVNRRRLVRGLVRRYAHHLRSPRVLDAGCGTGVNLADYESFGATVGIEFDPHAAILCAARGHHRVVVGSLCRLPFGDARFDLVISTDVIEHIDDDAAALIELRRVLAAGGRMVITTPAYSWAYSSHDRFLHHVRRYDTVRLRDTIERARLQVVHWSRYNALLALPLVAARRWRDRRARGNPNGSDVGRPLPRFMAPILNTIWRGEAFLAQRINLRVGLTHVVVLKGRDDSNG